MLLSGCSDRSYSNSYESYRYHTLKKKSERKKLVAKLDILVSIYIRKRDKCCVCCGSTQKLTNGHIFSRDTYSTRWDIADDGNCHAQCWPCNYRHEFDTYDYHRWYIERFGEEKFAELHKRYREVKKFKDADLELMIEAVKIKIDSLT